MRSPRLLKLVAQLMHWSLRLLLGVALLLAVLAAALHWWIVPRINDFRPQVESRLSAALQVPVQIAQLQADGGSSLVPQLQATGVRIAQPDGSDGLLLDKVEVALSVRSLLRLRTEKITIHAPTLVVKRAADGAITVAGIPVQPQTGGAPSQGADWVFGQREIVLQGGTVVWEDAQRAQPPLTFTDVQLLLRNPGLRHEWQASARPPTALGDVLELRGRFSQPLWALHDGDWKHWKGQLYLAANRLDAAGMAPYMPANFHLQQGQGAARLWLDVDRGRVKQGTADVALSNVVLRRERTELQDKLAVGARSTGDSSYQNNSKSPDEPAGSLLLRSVQGRLGGHADERGFTLFTEKLEVESADGERWPGGTLRVNHAYAAGTAPSETEAEAQQLDIASLAALARALPIPANARQWLAAHRPAGVIDSASARWRGDADALSDWRVKAAVTGLAFGLPDSAAPTGKRAAAAVARNADGSVLLAPGAAHVGLRGLNVSLEAGASGGHAQLGFAQGALYLPTVFEDPLLPLDQASTQLRWTVQGDAVQLESDRVEFANADAQGFARFQWRTADPAKSSAKSRYPGVLSLQGELQRADGTRVHRYLPLHVPASARHYVRDAVKAGKASKVQFQVKGDLHDMPFSKPGSGIFRIAAPVRDAVYAYVPDTLLHEGEKPWPVLSKLSGELVFEGATMQVKNAKGILDGNDALRVENATARIDDLEHTRVLVAAQARGPLPEMLATVKKSAIDALTNHALQQAEATGDAQLELKLELPVAHLDQSKVEGAVRLAGNRVHFHTDAPVVEQVSGAVLFSDKGFSLHQLQGQTLGGTVQLSGGMDTSTLTKGADVGRAVDVRATGTATAQGLRDATNMGPLATLARLAQGQASYQLQLGIAHSQPQVKVSSDMQGMAWGFPAPLNKPADAAWPMRFSLMSDANSTATSLRDHMELDLGERGQLHYVRHMGAEAASPAKVVQGAIRVGAGPALALPAQGVAAQVDVARVDVPEWLRAIDVLKATPAPVASALPKADATSQPAPPPVAAPQVEAAVPALQAVAVDKVMEYVPDQWLVRVGRVQVRGIEIAKLQLRGARRAGHWTSQVSSSLLDGQLEYQQEKSGPGTVRARLKQLRVTESSADAKTPEESTAAEAQPNQLPALDVVVEQLQWHGHDAGRLELQAVNRTEGAQSWWQLNQLALHNDAASLQASGDWGRQRGAAMGPGKTGPRRTNLDMRLDLKDTGALLERLGMPGVVSHGKGMLQGRIDWVGSPFSPDYKSMDGALHIDVGQGQFLKVEPGIAKLLGVLNLQALPRRLTLDFKDIFSAGFGFDFVRGDVTINDGLASTTNLQMKGVTAAVLLEGKANLRDETQDLHVVVIPELNTMTMSLVTTAINPIIGIGTFVAQALLKGKLVDAMTQEFAVTGSWSDPEVNRVQRAAKAASEPKTNEALP